MGWEWRVFIKCEWKDNESDSHTLVHYLGEDTVPPEQWANCTVENRSDLYYAVGEPNLGLKFRDLDSKINRHPDKGGRIELKVKVENKSGGWEKWKKIISQNVTGNKDEHLHHTVKRTVDGCRELVKDHKKLHEFLSASLSKQDSPRCIRVDKVRIQYANFEQTDVTLYELSKDGYRNPNYLGTWRSFSVEGKADSEHADTIAEKIPETAIVAGYPGFIEAVLAERTF